MMYCKEEMKKKLLELAEIMRGDLQEHSSIFSVPVYEIMDPMVSALKAEDWDRAYSASYRVADDLEGALQLGMAYDYPVFREFVTILNAM